ncbi:chemotaxis protein CheD [soil metagenome]|uniref:chemotaxis protein CheD n=1 Tax=Sphingobium sp. CECT 9361 TaxID=2845384 RepID=UPI001E389A7B|nr:chemotaxis protein CheD [Sphingobium sp. CECT 9361]CAH0356122.1 Chemoreceptor glutamine deamidase CheD [Sphingobium sp. CECT 9361]
MRRVSIIQGENHVSGEPEVVISTLLGSCVSVCLQDPQARIGGMNHFLLGEPGKDHQVDRQGMQRYGVHAMELLINELMRKGANRSRLRAQLYGGANIIAGLGSIGSGNAAFARRFMETESIPIGHCDLGGTQARRVEFVPYEGKARSRLLTEPPKIVRAPVVLPTGGGDLDLF